jgi:cleavage and polyadenylation specificity factor subunit 2
MADTAGLLLEPSQRDLRSGQLEVQKQEIPENSKRVERQISVEVYCRVEFVDFEGLSDRESVLFKIDAMKPKKVIIVHTETTCGQLLKQGLEMRECKTVLLPKQDETIDLAQDVSKFKVRLQEAVYNILDRHTIGQYEVAFLKSKCANVDGHYQLQPPDDPGHAPVYVTKGELELSKGMVSGPPRPID